MKSLLKRNRSREADALEAQAKAIAENPRSIERRKTYRPPSDLLLLEARKPDEATSAYWRRESARVCAAAAVILADGKGTNGLSAKTIANWMVSEVVFRQWHAERAMPEVDAFLSDYGRRELQVASS